MCVGNLKRYGTLALSSVTNLKRYGGFELCYGSFELSSVTNPKRYGSFWLCYGSFALPYGRNLKRYGRNPLCYGSFRLSYGGFDQSGAGLPVRGSPGGSPSNGLAGGPRIRRRFAGSRFAGRLTLQWTGRWSETEGDRTAQGPPDRDSGPRTQDSGPRTKD